jgi:hypothetical protein
MAVSTAAVVAPAPLRRQMAMGIAVPGVTVGPQPAAAASPLERQMPV